MTRHVLAIDQGTTGSTCLMFAADGTVVAGPATRPLAGHDRLAGDDAAGT